MSDIFIINSGMALLFDTYVVEIRIALVMLLVFAAAVIDARSHRIPNWLTLSGMVLGVAWHGLSPFGWGWSYALKGAAVGFGFFIPLYLIRAMGAGDVKLMAAVGALLGPIAAVGAALMSLVAGGVLAIAVAVCKRALPSVITNIRFILRSAVVKAALGDGMRLESAPSSAGTLPYAFAIAAGTFVQAVLMNSGRMLLG